MISVIVPVYKVEPYLRECIDSILAQTYRDFELILIDDGSPDNCGVICDEYAARDSRIQVIHQDNCGVSVARNTGLDAVKGEYISFVDSDDVVHPDYLKYLMRGIEENQVDISIVGFERFSDGEIPALSGTYFVKALMDGIDACHMLYSNRAIDYTVPWGKIYKAELFAGIRYPIGKVHEDEGTTYKLLYKAQKVVELDAKLYGYRMNPTGIMGSTFSEKRYQAVTFFEERIEFFKSHGHNDLAEMAEKGIPVTLAKMYIMAKNAGVEEKIPKKYQMSVFRALRIIQKNCTDDNYSYYLSLVYPRLLRPHSYLRKIKKILHIPCK